MNLTNPTDLGEDRFYRIDGYIADAPSVRSKPSQGREVGNACQTLIAVRFRRSFGTTNLVAMVTS